jgi:hypothetical protein
MSLRKPADSFEPNGADDPEDADVESLLDEEFPLGDGTADTQAEVQCPWCAAIVVIALDPGGGSVQEYVEDCEVCCQPWAVSLSYHEGSANVSVRALDT